MQLALRFVFESVRFPLDSTKSNGGRFFPSRRPGCGHDGSTAPQRHHDDQGMPLR
jgi:hypothetical protein